MNFDLLKDASSCPVSRCGGESRTLSEFASSRKRLSASCSKSDSKLNCLALPHSQISNFGQLFGEWRCGSAAWGSGWQMGGLLCCCGWERATPSNFERGHGRPDSPAAGPFACKTSSR